MITHHRVSRNPWMVFGKRGIDVRWYVSVNAWDAPVGVDPTRGPFKRLWIARLYAWWLNLIRANP